MITLKSLEKEKARLLLSLENIETHIKEFKSKTLVQCVSNYRYSGKGCGMGHEIRSLEYIQTHWYESPYGCTGGDSWYQGEGNFICPHCGYRNRLYNRKEIEELKHLFKSVIEEHER